MQAAPFAFARAPSKYSGGDDRVTALIDKNTSWTKPPLPLQPRKGGVSHCNRGTESRGYPLVEVPIILAVLARWVCRRVD